MKDNWIYIGASATGLSHFNAVPPIPCQDAYAHKSVYAGWGISIVCDGAGSAKNSHIGSRFVANRAIEIFELIIFDNNLISLTSLPSQEEWEKLSKDGFLRLRLDLEDFALENNYAFTSLACTIICVIHSPLGILICHVGDGRGAYLNGNIEWNTMFSPHETDQDNITIFLTSEQWTRDGYKMNNVSVPESKVIEGVMSAYALLTDGMEMHSFNLGYFDEAGEIFYPENKPFKGFFNNVFLTLKKMISDGVPEDEINKKWSEFINGGTNPIKEEADDKTMLFVINGANDAG